MKCPHCLVAFHENWRQTVLGDDADSSWLVETTICPACERMTVALVKALKLVEYGGGVLGYNPLSKTYVRPKGVARAPVPVEVPSEIAALFFEAVAVFPESASASAALSRRCLQQVLRDYAKVKAQDLSREIDELLQRNTLPSHLAESIDAVRHIGNFAAHPIKSQVSGQILEVEPGEAEWTIEVLEMLFDFYFVQPELARKKRDALNAKLKTAGKPPLK